MFCFAFYLSCSWNFLSFLFFVSFGRDGLVGGGGNNACFIFFQFVLLHLFNHAFISYQIMSWWYWQNHVKGMVFMSCFAQKSIMLAKQNLFSFFLFSLGRPKHIKSMCTLFFFHSSRLQVHICIYICIYVYIHHMANLSPFSLLGRDSWWKKGKEMIFILSILSSLEANFSKLN